MTRAMLRALRRAEGLRSVTAGAGGRFVVGLMASVAITLFSAATVCSAESIHSGYAVTTNACKSCHGVHDNPNPKLFMTSEVVEGCNYCHVQDGGGIRVYVGSAVHRVDGNGVLIPDATTNSPIGGELDCLDCHSAAPHGAGQGLYGHLTKSADAVSFCLGCHDVNDGRVVDGSRVSSSTHVMIAAGVAYAESGATTATHADSGATSEFCASCHVDATDYPHSGNFKLLRTGAAAYALDSACRDCHGSGVGVVY